VSEPAAERCSDRSRAAGEQLPGTAATVDRWLLLEVPGSWSRDVGSGAGLPDAVRATVSSWLANATERRRLLFVRRPGRAPAPRLAFVVRAHESSHEVRRIELDRIDRLAGVELERFGDAVDARLVLVCGHGTRDACCALRGTAVYGALVGRLDDEELWISSHQGGHRFAPNVLVLPLGLQLGRVEPDEAPAVVARALEGRIELDRYRGRTCYPPAVQAAEHAIRAARGLAGVSELSLVDADSEVIRFRDRNGDEHAARVVEREGPAVAPSCGDAPEPQRTFVAQLL
jgi:hypothetical protein